MLLVAPEPQAVSEDVANAPWKARLWAAQRPGKPPRTVARPEGQTARPLKPHSWLVARQ